MRIEETFQVQSPIDKVWEFISDPPQMATCLPAVQSVNVLDVNHYEMVVKQKIGIITATFRIQTAILERHPPQRLVLSNNGKTIFGASGLMKSTDTILLTPVTDLITNVHVVSELSLGGQLAILGAKLIQSKSKAIFDEATANLKRRLESPGPSISVPVS